MDARWLERLTMPAVVILGAALGGLLAFATSLMHSSGGGAAG